ncbi:MAG: hypothetical protein QMD32_05965, partial [Smithellaceae bacterium]|nr:hypothetical protein [Smithellaceae bacterium]
MWRFFYSQPLSCNKVFVHFSSEHSPNLLLPALEASKKFEEYKAADEEQHKDQGKQIKIFLGAIAYRDNEIGRICGDNS